MIFKYDKFNIILSSVLIEKLKTFIQNDSSKPESGGILIGSLYDDRVEILDCSEPTKFDEQSRFNFTRSKKSGQNFINEKFKQSKGKEIYLGEWHTHPEKHPTPSCTDRLSFSKTLANNQLNSNIHFMIIVGIKTVYIGIYINKRSKKSLHFTI